MSEPRDKNPSLWRSIAEAQECVVRDERALDRLRQAIMQPPERRVRVPRWALPATLATAAATVALFGLTWRQPTFKVGTNEGAVGVVLSAEQEHLPVRFADGSEVVLAQGSRGQVTRLSETGADVVLTGGALQAHVVHSERTRWVFHAGPYQILVTGTRFVAAWEPKSRTLKVRMTEGSVRIGGGGLQSEVAVRAGQEFTASQGEGRYALMEAAPVPAVAPGASLLASGPDHAPGVPLPEPASATAVALPPAPPLAAAESTPTLAPTEAPAGGDPDASWLKAAAAGDHRRAFSLAQKRGIKKLILRLDAPDLLLLADTARYVHQPAAATQAFLALASRFPDAPESTDALFGLGRMAFQDGQWADAARWFRKVVEQRREGPLLEAAWGRLMESLDRASDPGARAMAVAYLERFSNGHHRALAERIRAAH